MISEITFIRHYNSFWNELLPGVDQYVRMINSGLKERHFNPIEIEDDPMRRALINSISFHIFYLISVGSFDFETVEKWKINQKELIEIQGVVLFKLKGLNNSEDFEKPININELNIIILIIKRLCQNYSKKVDLKVYPEFYGCGLLFPCSADVFANNTLIEVKAGLVNFKRQDILQLLTYAALNSIMENKLDIKKYSIFNPRTGHEWIEDIETVSEFISGGASSEIYAEILNYITNNYRSI